MDLRKIWRQRAASGAEKAHIERITPDISVPRECIYDSFDGEAGPCPRCGSKLIQSNQTYQVATKSGRRLADSFIIGSDFGWFCTNCPAVVINQTKVSELLSFSKPDWDVGSEWVVLGILNLDSIPREKRHLPLGTEDNPTPLVAFSNLHRAASAGRSTGSLTRIARKRPFSKKRRR